MPEQLPAGRELDALVAEKIMGECVHDVEPTGEPYGFGGVEYECKKCGATFGDCHPTVSPYSTSICAAWRVMEKLRSLGWHINIDSCKDGWRASNGYFYGETAPLAICRGALGLLSARSPNVT